MKYHSGEEIRKGDKVLFHSEPGEIEFVVERLTGDPAMDWHIKEQGAGVMVLEPRSFNRAYVCDPNNVEDLQFVSRD
jgi:hypothetical protein